MKIRTSFTYLCISGCCFLGHNAIMIVADSLCVALWLAILLSFAIIATVGYILHSLFTFKQPLSFAGFGRYTISMLLNIPLASLCMLVLNFLLSRWAISTSGRSKAIQI